MIRIISLFLVCFAIMGYASASDTNHGEEIAFPRSLDSYEDADKTNIIDILSNRIAQSPFNLIAAIIFLCAILHSFMTSKFLKYAHKWEHEHIKKINAGKLPRESVHMGAEMFHFLGEIEVVFGIWALALGVAITAFYDWHTVIYYIGKKVNYTEPMFVVVIMTLAASRPVLKFSEFIMEKIANAVGGTLTAWWLTILTLGPILGSFITEPAAMTISALLLSSKFYQLEPSNRFKYATLGLLFVNISVGGTLSHFAAPPVLMVAGPWDWGMGFMMLNFGWKAVLGIIIANGIYYFIFRNELNELQEYYFNIKVQTEIKNTFIKQKEIEDEFDEIRNIVSSELGFTTKVVERCDELKDHLKAKLFKKLPKNIDSSQFDKIFDDMFESILWERMITNLPGLLPDTPSLPFRDPNYNNRIDPKVPAWIIFFHLLFMGWTIMNAHYPALFIAGFLFFIGFAKATQPFQNRIDLKPPLLVGFFLAGLLIHGGVQAWWIAPVLSSFSEIPLLIGATVLTAFNDNAAITYLSTLVPGFTDGLKYAVVAGAVSGGGLTIIANAPNPAGQSILNRHFKDGISPGGLLIAAIIPTLVMLFCFLLFRF